MVTNYERITKSPEKLAMFLDKLMSNCGCCILTEVEESVPDCDARCPYLDRVDCKFDTLEWLQEECEQDLHAITPETLIEVVHLFDK